jgi:hypothetical protein
VIIKYPGFEPTSPEGEVTWEQTGIHSQKATVVWTPPALVPGEYSEYGYLGTRISFDAEGYIPETCTKTYTLQCGQTENAWSDTFTARYRDPCANQSAPPQNGNTWSSADQKIKAPRCSSSPGDPDPNPDPNPGPLPPPPNNPPIVVTDPYERETETISGQDCNPPFLAQTCVALNHPDKRIPADLPPPATVEIVAENITFDHQKRGYLAYTHDPEIAPIPKYFLTETATTSLTGGTPESPVGGTISKSICRMTGAEITTARTGNPSWYGVREGPGVALTETTASGSIEVESYDDCPNTQDDAPGTLLFSSLLSDEYTKPRMRTDTFQNSWEFKGTRYFKQEVPLAALLIDSKEGTIHYQKTQYKIRVPANVPRPHTVNWFEEFTPEDTNPEDGVEPEKIYVLKTATITGAESAVYMINPAQTPDKEGSWRVFLLPVEVISDLNNDGQITATDNPLRDAAMASGATDEIKDKGTEFIFHNDTLSNGIWDKEDTDPARPATEKDDDDAEEIRVKVGITEGEVWLDHPAIAKLSFYKTRECKPADKVNLSPTSKFTVSASNPFPDKLFMRADVDGAPTYPEADPQFAGDLVLKIKVGTNGQEIEAVKMKLTVVRHFGAQKFFNAARDYIFERNVKLYVCERVYESSLTRWRLCVMAEDLTSLQPVETYHGPTPVAGTSTKPVGPFGFNLVAAYNSDFTVLINGPQVFFDYGFGWPVPIPPSKQKYFALVNGFYNPNPIMTDKSHGRFVIRNSGWLGGAYSELSPTSSDDTAQPKGSELAGDTAEYVSQSGDGLWEFGTGRLPLLPAAGVGGLSDNHASPDRVNHNTALIGHAEIPKKGVGCVFVATHKPDGMMAGVNISEFVDSSITSKVDKNPSTGTSKLYMTDGGYATVALAHKTPNDDLKTVVFGPAVNYPVMVGQGLTGNFNQAPVNYHLGVPYYTNVYIGLKSEKPRN